ncbi:MAG TPA: DUF488 domain-containing protein [Aliidongia sp.]|nr:DUF488 domain-containing protein [Aliidongia sp.]
MTEIFTIGYEKASLADFIDTLRAAEVKTLIDVRELPQSRRAGFSKNMLAASVGAVGIRYVHLKALGTPKEGRTAHRSRHYDEFWRIVETRMVTPEAKSALAEAAEIAKAEASCLMCFEADWHICHRARVVEALEREHGFSVHHLAVEPKFI